jgi:hypothetical protein
MRSRVEHVFAAQKCPLRLVVRTIGMVRARVKIGLANLAYNFTRLAWLNGQAVPARCPNPNVGEAITAKSKTNRFCSRPDIAANNPIRPSPPAKNGVIRGVLSLGGRHVREPVKFRRGQNPVGGSDVGRELVVRRGLPTPSIPNL